MAVNTLFPSKATLTGGAGAWAYMLGEPHSIGKGKKRPLRIRGRPTRTEPARPVLSARRVPPRLSVRRRRRVPSYNPPQADGTQDSAAAPTPAFPRLRGPLPGPGLHSPLCSWCGVAFCRLRRPAPAQAAPRPPRSAVTSSQCGLVGEVILIPGRANNKRPPLSPGSPTLPLHAGPSTEGQAGNRGLLTARVAGPGLREGRGVG